jgi:hypothetical protein
VKYLIHFHVVRIGGCWFFFLLKFLFRLSRFIIKIIRTITNKTNNNIRNSSSSIFNPTVRTYWINTL